MGCQNSTQRADLEPVDLTDRTVGQRILLPPQYCKSFPGQHGPNVELPFVVRVQENSGNGSGDRDDKFIRPHCEYCLVQDHAFKKHIAENKDSFAGASALGV
mmetsp:Transcript_23702/g.56029  ORF Transcript_23702/g.56029 Transcript_23702/m.56029 type:complete len:102 (-) Transcript_23702:487-792(-)